MKEKTIYIVWETDMWQSKCSIYGVVDSIKNGIALLREDGSVLLGIINKDCHIVIYSYSVNKRVDSGKVFSTEYERDKILLMEGE